MAAPKKNWGKARERFLVREGTKDILDQLITKNSTETLDKNRQKCREFIEIVLKTKLPELPDDLDEALVDGVILCQLLEQGFDVKLKIYNGKLKFKTIENIRQFLAACTTLNVPNNYLFQPFELSDKKDMRKVYDCILSLQRMFNSRRSSVITSPRGTSDFKPPKTPRKDQVQDQVVAQVEVKSVTPKSEPVPEAKTQPDVKPEAAQIKSQPVETKPEPQPDVKSVPEPQPEVKPVPESQSEVKPEVPSEPEKKPEPQPEAKPEPQPEAEPEPQPEAKPEPQPEVKTEPQHQIASESRVEPRAQTGSESLAVASSQPQPDLQLQAASQPEPQVGAKSEPQPEPQSGTRPEPHSEVEQDLSEPKETDRDDDAHAEDSLLHQPIGDTSIQEYDFIWESKHEVDGRAYVIGSFSYWELPFEMEKKPSESGENHVYCATVPLQAGEYQYKFLVAQTWHHSPSQPIVVDGNYVNNYIHILTPQQKMSRKLVTFTWKESGTDTLEDVYVIGTFSHWWAKFPLNFVSVTNGERVYSTELLVEPGEHQFKFIRNGQWVLASGLEIVSDAQFTNHYLFVE